MAKRKLCCGKTRFGKACLASVFAENLCSNHLAKKLRGEPCVPPKYYPEPIRSHAKFLADRRDFFLAGGVR